MHGGSLLKASVLGGVCAVAGVAGGIAESSAATHHPAAQRSTNRWGAWSRGGPAAGWGGGRTGLGFGAIRASVIEPAADGGYDHITYDTGVLMTVGADSLTVHEGSRTVTYARPTLMLNGKTTVWLNHKRARLSTLAAPDRVAVIRSSSGTNTVLATTPKFTASFSGPGTYAPSWGPGSSHGDGWNGTRHGWNGSGYGWNGPGNGWTRSGGWTGHGGQGSW